MAYIGNQPLATEVTNADISSSAAIDLSKLATSGDLSATNVTLGGYLRGPSTFTIDPAAHGDNTGTLVIAGNLQVDGTTTTVNSTTMEVDDLNITVASGAANAAAADGAGITVDGASATLLYNATPDAWSFNKNLGIGATPQRHLHINGGNETTKIQITNQTTGSSTDGDGFQLGIATNGTANIEQRENADMLFSTNNTERLRILSDGGFLIGKTSASLGTTGLQATSGGAVVGITRDGGASFNVNRLTSDGDLIGLYKDTTTVGSISTEGGYTKIIGGNGSVGSGLGFFNLAINARTASGAVADGTVSLGETSNRFKDLYLSGGVVETTTTVTYASSIALTYDNGSIQTVTLTGNVTFTDSLNDGEAIVLMLNGGASHTVTWTAVTKWVTGSGNAAPTLTASDAIILWKIGSSVYAATAGSFA